MIKKVFPVEGFFIMAGGPRPLESWHCAVGKPLVANGRNALRPKQQFR